MYISCALAGHSDDVCTLMLFQADNDKVRNSQHTWSVWSKDQPSQGVHKSIVSAREMKP